MESKPHGRAGTVATCVVLRNGNGFRLLCFPLYLKGFVVGERYIGTHRAARNPVPAIAGTATGIAGIAVAGTLLLTSITSPQKAVSTDSFPAIKTYDSSADILGAKKIQQERLAKRIQRAVLAAKRRAKRQALLARQAAQRAAQAATTTPSPTPSPVAVSSTEPSIGTIQRTAYDMLSSYGWNPATEFVCLNNIYVRESGWSWDATNPSSGAYGIPQALPGSKMASAGSDWQTNPITQIKWGLGYIKAVYGSPCNAWAYWQAHGAY